MVRGGEDAVVGELVFAGMRCYSDEALDERDWVKAKGLGAVAQGERSFQSSSAESSKALRAA